jgi:polysaccharide chain length determinant protein (PEP-CTERM system associated)
MITPPGDLVRGLAREVLSRPRLLRIIEELGLYPDQKRTDDLADAMREVVGVTPIDASGRDDFSAFKLTYTAETPHLAQTVTTRLASLFIEENLRVREDQAAKTASFLSAQLEEAKRRLVEEESRLKSFKIGNLGRLPEEQSANLTALTALRAQLQTVMDNRARAEQMRTALDAAIGGHLGRLEAEKSELLTRFTAQHVQVVKKNAELKKYQLLLDFLRAGSSSERLQVSGTTDDIAYVQLRTQVESSGAEVQRLTNDEKRLKVEIAQYQGRLNLTPVVEQQLASILRDYEQHKKDYTELLGQQLKSHMAANIEERQQGQHFRLIDPPSFPELPSSPKRGKFLLGGAAVGAALGLLLGLLRHFMDRSFHSEAELIQEHEAPLVVSIPLVLTADEFRRRKWRRFWEYALGIALLVAIALAELRVLRMPIAEIS